MTVRSRKKSRSNETLLAGVMISHLQFTLLFLTAETRL